MKTLIDRRLQMASGDVLEISAGISVDESSKTLIVSDLFLRNPNVETIRRNAREVSELKERFMHKDATVFLLT